METQKNNTKIYYKVKPSVLEVIYYDEQNQFICRTFVKKLRSKRSKELKLNFGRNYQNQKFLLLEPFIEI